MDALLGKIAGITREESPDAADASSRYRVRFKAACVLPRRGAPPEWLKDQVLTVSRSAGDAREIGGPGDSIVLTPRESAPWLYPLGIDPPLAHGALPPTLEVRLRWWKDDKPPEFEMRANGRVHSAAFTPDGDGGFTASVPTSVFFDIAPALPVTFAVTCDRFQAAATIVPAGEPWARKIALLEGERYRCENPWFVVDVSGASHGGGIAALRERGRDLDHFARPADRIQTPFHEGGHTDRFRTGWQWSDKLDTAGLSLGAIRREGGATRIDLEGVVDEGQNLRTSVAYAVYDDLPLITLSRDFRFGKGKDESKDPKPPREPIDDLFGVGLSFRAASAPERNGTGGSRVLCAHEDRLAAARSAEVNDQWRFDGWKMKDGWALVEHPHRRSYLLYLFDRQTPPHLAVWHGPNVITLEPYWPFQPVRADEAVGFQLAISAGEAAGAMPEGAWVACRAPLPDGGVRCALIARLRAGKTEEGARFTLGGETRTADLRQILLPAVGLAACGTADFPGGQMSDAFDAEAGGIPARRPE